MPQHRKGLGRLCYMSESEMSLACLALHSSAFFVSGISGIKGSQNGQKWAFSACFRSKIPKANLEIGRRCPKFTDQLITRKTKCTAA